MARASGIKLDDLRADKPEVTGYDLIGSGHGRSGPKRHSAFWAIGAVVVALAVVISVVSLRPGTHTPTVVASTGEPAVPHSASSSSTTANAAPTTALTGPAAQAGGLDGSSGTFDSASGALTAELAAGIFQTVWPAFTAGLDSGGQSFARYASPELAEAVNGYFICGCTPWPSDYQAVTFSAPEGQAFPRSFLAEIQEIDFDRRAIVIEAVFVQQASGAPWLITNVVTYTGGAPFLAGSTVDEPTPAVPIDPSVVGAQIAAYLQTVFNTGRPPKTWPATGSLGQEVARIDSGREVNAANHWTETLSYTAGPVSPAFPTSDGILMCGSIHAHSVTYPAAGAKIVQPPDQSAFGATLAAGSYSSVTKDGVRDVCWTVSTTGVTTPVSFMGGTFSIMGRP